MLKNLQKSILGYCRFYGKRANISARQNVSKFVASFGSRIQDVPIRSLSIDPNCTWFSIRQVSDENRRLEKLLRQKETQICESETKAKELSLRAEEFEELFNAQLSSVKGLQADLSVASNENRALVKEMEMLNQMFNAMERQYAHHATTSSSSSQKTSQVKKPAFGIPFFQDLDRKFQDPDRNCRALKSAF